MILGMEVSYRDFYLYDTELQRTFVVRQNNQDGGKDVLVSPENIPRIEAQIENDMIGLIIIGKKVYRNPLIRNNSSLLNRSGYKVQYANSTSELRSEIIAVPLKHSTVYFQGDALIESDVKW